MDAKCLSIYWFVHLLSLLEFWNVTPVLSLILPQINPRTFVSQTWMPSWYSAYIASELLDSTKGSSSSGLIDFQLCYSNSPPFTCFTSVITGRPPVMMWSEQIFFATEFEFFLLDSHVMWCIFKSVLLLFHLGKKVTGPYQRLLFESSGFLTMNQLLIFINKFTRLSKLEMLLPLFLHTLKVQAQNKLTVKYFRLYQCLECSCDFFLTGIHSMQCKTRTTRKGVTRKRRR